MITIIPRLHVKYGPWAGRVIRFTVVALILLFVQISAFAAAEPGPFDAERFTISPFAAHKVTEFGKSTGKWAGGLALSYAPVDHIAIEASALSYKLQDNPVVESIDEAAINFKGYLPLGHSDWAPYGLIGYTRDHANDDNLMNAGAGLAYHYQWLEAFADGQYRQNFASRGNQFLFRAGLGFSF